MQKTAKAYVFNEAGTDCSPEVFPLPKLAEGELLVKNSICTICSSDLHSFTGKRKEQTPCILGHEIIGTIADIGGNKSQYDYSGKLLSIGDRITWSLTISCGVCQNCKNDLTQKCIELKKYGHSVVVPDFTFNGGFAEYTHLKQGTAIFKLSTHIPIKFQSPLNCSYATVAAAIRNAGEIKNKKILIFGAGMLGIITTAMAKSMNVREIVIIDPNFARLETAWEFGAKLGINWKQDKDKLTDNICDYQADIIFEMSGSNAAINASFNMLSTGGSLILVGSVFPTNNIQINPEKLVRKLWTIKGVHNYNAEDLKFAIQFLEENIDNFPFELLYDPITFKLDNCNEAMHYALQSKKNRVVVNISQDNSQQ